MQIKRILLSVTSLAVTALCLTVSTAQASQKKTTIKINGQFATVFLVAPGINGQLSTSKDNVANTTGLDYSYGFADPDNPDAVILIIGAGPIPNDALTIT